jgi:hypothetical protein
VNLSLTLLCLSQIAVSYPLISEVDVGIERCLTYVIPPHDESHMVFVAIKPAPTDKVEDYFVNLVLRLTKEAGKNPDKRPIVPDIPKDMQNILDESASFDDGVLRDEAKTGMASNLRLEIKVPGRHPFALGADSMLSYNEPVILQNIRQMAAKAGYKRDDDLFQVCFKNTNTWKQPHDLDIIFDTTLEDVEDDDGKEVAAMKRKVIRRDHITPLEEQLEESLERAEDILDEYKYMEKRERRMRQTADSTNANIRMFSYISILILLVVTGLQVTYLKGYFKKKKLM